MLNVGNSLQALGQRQDATGTFCRFQLAFG